MKAAILHGIKQKLNVEETEFGLVNSDHVAVQVQIFVVYIMENAL